MNQMSNSTQTPGFGRVWERKNRSNDKAPEYDGRLTLPDGTEVRIALWRAPNGNGFNIKLSNMTDSASPAGRNEPPMTAKRPEPVPAMHDFDDEVPF